MRRTAAISLALLCAFPILAQDRKFGEKVDVNLVLLDTIVTDSSGNQILGLDKGDFVVTENGTEQTVDSADYFTNRRLLNSPEGNAPFQVERIHSERHFIFFFDKPGDGQVFDQLARARAAAKHFVEEQMKPGDLVAIAGHDIRLKIYSDFTGDKGALVKALNDSAFFGPGLTRSTGASGPSILGQINATKMMSHSGTVYEALTVLADSLRPIKARKNLVLFSAGIHEPGETIRDGILLNRSRYYDSTLQALNASNTSVFAANLIPDAPEVPAIHQTLDSLANGTNGEYFRHVVSFESPLTRIEQATNGYYLLSYVTHREPGARGYQKVQVTVRNQPQLRVHAREGYRYGE